MAAGKGVLAEYGCAIQRSFLLHGQMSVTREGMVFECNILGYAMREEIRFADVTAIVRRNAALVVPNALEITTTTDSFFFASFRNRDKVYRVLTYLWQQSKLPYPPSPRTVTRVLRAMQQDQLDQLKLPDELPDMRNADHATAAADAASAASAHIAADALQSSAAVVAPRRPPPTERPRVAPQLDSVLESELEGSSDPPAAAAADAAAHATEATAKGNDAVFSSNDPMLVADREVIASFPDIQEQGMKVLVKHRTALTVKQTYALVFSSESTFISRYHERRGDVENNFPAWNQSGGGLMTRLSSYRSKIRSTMGPPTTIVDEHGRLAWASETHFIVEARNHLKSAPMASKFHLLTRWDVKEVAPKQTEMTAWFCVVFTKSVFGLRSIIIDSSASETQESYELLVKMVEEEVANPTPMALASAPVASSAAATPASAARAVAGSAAAHATGLSPAQPLPYAATTAAAAGVAATRLHPVGPGDAAAAASTTTLLLRLALVFLLSLIAALLFVNLYRQIGVLENELSSVRHAHALLSDTLLAWSVERGATALHANGGSGDSECGGGGADGYVGHDAECCPVADDAAQADAMAARVRVAAELAANQAKIRDMDSKLREMETRMRSWIASEEFRDQRVKNDMALVQALSVQQSRLDQALSSAEHRFADLAADIGRLEQCASTGGDPEPASVTAWLRRVASSLWSVFSLQNEHSLPLAILLAFVTTTAVAVFA